MPRGSWSCRGRASRCQTPGPRAPRCLTPGRSMTPGRFSSAPTPRMCRVLLSAAPAPKADPSRGWSPPACNNTLSSTDFTRRCRPSGGRRSTAAAPRPTGCMAKTERRKKPRTVPTQIELAVRAADDKQAIELVVLDLRKAAGFTDFFVICSGSNPRQIRAIADAVMEALAADGTKPAHVEGYDRSEWVLLDYFDFVVHVFAPDTRLFYSLERLWGNAERIEVPAGAR